MSAPAFRLILLAAVLASCAPKRREPPSLTSGHLVVAADASLKPLLDELIRVYSGRYPDVQIQARYGDEQQVAEWLLGDTAQIALISGKFTDEELLPLREKGEAVRQFLFAADGLAFLINRQRSDTVYTLSGLYDLLEGHPRQQPPATLIVPGMRSALHRSLQQLLPQGRTLTDQIFAVADEEAVVRYVEENPHAVGVISSSWISRGSDSISEAILRRAYVLALTDTAGRSCKPVRAHLFSRCYPLLREIYLVIREKGVGVGMGFGTFLLAQDGQLVVHRFGLLAVKQPVRVIEVKKEF
ncbi:MAG: substrate-binding domain-containing protein [Chitinophagales bacterium]|nr:substrate-binding domain-containing protein [Chitinophagales bacterium]MDW8393654.1 substrate-binding domain-containing protein [Chitinophagales bacterium]